MKFMYFLLAHTYSCHMVFGTDLTLNTFSHKTVNILLGYLGPNISPSFIS